MDLKLDGKRALVTGSNSGIGRAIAQMLAAEGVSVVVHGRDRARTQEAAADIRAKGGKAAVALGDLMADASADEVAKAALDAFGGIDILVNKAGGHATQTVGWFAISADDWLATANMNVGAAVRMIQRLAGPMKERGWGRIIQIGSFSGRSGDSGDYPAYSAAKAATENLSFVLSRELKFSGVTVNTVAPGLIATEGFELYLDGASKHLGMTHEQATTHTAITIMNQKVKRLGVPEDVGRLVAYLASPHADFITGTTLRIDGGAFPSA